MPYYPEDQSESNLNQLRWNNVCAVCGRVLYIYIDLKDKRKCIACPTPGHEGIARQYEKPREDYESNLRREYEVEKEHGIEASRALATLPKHGQLTQVQAEHVLSLVYPGVPKDEIVRCAILCRDFGLHPLMKEVYIIPFGQGEKRTWATVLGINATRKLMAQRGTYSYIDDTPRLMTEVEQKRIFGKVDPENIVAITKLRTKDGLEAQGYGKWPKNKEPYGTDKGNSPENMTFIRSERNAFGRLSPDALPPDVGVIDEAYAEIPDVGKVDTETGEIVEGEARELPDEAPVPTPEEHWCEEHQTNFFKRGRMKWYAHKIEGTDEWCSEIKKKESAAAEPETTEPEPETLAPPTRDPNTVKTLTELLKACHADFKNKNGEPMQPEDVYAELSVSSQNEITDTPADCYIKIKAVR